MEHQNSEQGASTPHAAADEQIAESPFATAYPKPTTFEEVELVELAPEPKRSRKGLVAVALAAVLALGIGVAVQRSSGPGVISLAKSAQLTQAQHSSRVEMTMKMPIAGFTDSPVLMTGLYDFDQKLMSGDMDLTAMLGSKLPATAPPDAGQMAMVTQGLVGFIRARSFDTVPALKDKWLKFDIASMGAQSGVDIRKAVDINSTDPGAILEQMKATASTVETIGKEDVRGVGTTHYRSTIDIEKFYRERNAIVDEAKFTKMLALYSGPISTEAWVGNDGLVRRIKNSLPMKSANIDVEMEFFDFGTPVDITLPADTDVVDQSQLAGMLKAKTP
jgi:hypothetical protein